MVELFAFTCGWFQAPLGFFIGGDEDEWVKSPVPAYLIRHPTKGLAVFDTGLGLRFRREVGVVLPPGQGGYEFDERAEIAARLRAMEIDPADVRWVINSHLHADHCGGNAAFPNATLVIQRRELEYARAEEGTRLYNSVDFETGQPILAINGEHDLFGDGSLILFPTYGHTPGHQSARVKLKRGDVVLAADCCYLKRNLDELRTSPSDKDQARSMEVLRGLKAMQERGTRIFFGHDPGFWRLIPQATAIE